MVHKPVTTVISYADHLHKPGLCIDAYNNVSLNLFVQALSTNNCMCPRMQDILRINFGVSLVHTRVNKYFRHDTRLSFTKQ